MLCASQGSALAGFVLSCNPGPSAPNSWDPVEGTLDTGQHTNKAEDESSLKASLCSVFLQETLWLCAVFRELSSSADVARGGFCAAKGQVLEQIL